jgi:hypothetical protein
MTINAEGVKISDPQREAIGEYPQITSYKLLQSFLGATNFFREFLPDLSTIAAPLFDLLKKSSQLEKPRFHDAWNTLHQSTVRLIQHLLISAPCLAFFNPALDTKVHSDASDFAMGGWVGQTGADGVEKVVAYWSRRLSPAERNYPTHEKEFLALFSVILRFRTYLFGHPFVALTDHRALEHIQDQPALRPRQIRWILQLQEFDFKVEYVKGELNDFADWLSRRPDFAAHVCDQCQQAASVSAIHHDGAPFLDLLLEKQQQDDFIQQLDSWKADAASIPYRQRGYFKSFSRLENGLWTYKNTLVIPDQELQVYFLKKAHSVGHLGVSKSLRELQKLAYWPSMRKDLEMFIAACDTCQRCNQTQHSYGLLKPLPIPDSRGLIVHLDFAAMPLDDGGLDNLLVITDRFSKLVAAIPCKMTVTGSGFVLYSLVSQGYRLPGSACNGS